MLHRQEPEHTRTTIYIHIFVVILLFNILLQLRVSTLEDIQEHKSM